MNHALIKFRILLADAQETMREGIKLLINAQPDMEVVGEAGDGLTAIERAQSLLPDIALIDVWMPGVSGFQVTKEMKQTRPRVKVLVLTRHRNSAYMQQLVSVGANGYVLKQSPAAELLRAIRAVAEGRKYLDSSMTGAVLANYAGEQMEINNLSRVSIREEEVLRMSAWGYTNKEIAEKLQISVKTVEAHRYKVQYKLGLHSRVDVVRFALRQGWLQEE